MPAPSSTLQAPIRAGNGLLGGWDASAAQKPRKRSLAIAGHRTSISLEQPFWDGLRTAALAEGVPIAALVAAIDAVRGEASLSSAIRLFLYDRQSEPARRVV
ncbi:MULTISPECIES: ribbon-helix-helix domain-containing protein [Rhodomicrobium]|uniref:ribbon-helix-helix domain-containing protein n=1 Tax=Rhodomicrobium TaxID=1068 RepID=UPI000B4B8755|nr:MULTISPECIES: ribbon-helix-helix domain-containing protein [Rhodomicrobium]